MQTVGGVLYMRKLNINCHKEHASHALQSNCLPQLVDTEKCKDLFRNLSGIIFI